LGKRPSYWVPGRCQGLFGTHLDPACNIHRTTTGTSPLVDVLQARHPGFRTQRKKNGTDQVPPSNMGKEADCVDAVLLLRLDAHLDPTCKRTFAMLLP
jgi:hypothetical protein